MKISIVTTVYNIEKYIERCMESLLAQTYKDIEIIVVDDCGKDSSMEIVSRYNDERIKIVRHSENMVLDGHENMVLKLLLVSM